MDTGATFSIVASDVIGEHYTSAGTVQIKGVGAEPKKYTTTNVAVNNHWTGTLDWNTGLEYWNAL